MHTLFCLFALLITMLPLHGTTPGLPLSEGGLHGVVLDPSSRTPLAGITIQFLPDGPQSLSDEKGRFHLPALPVGPCRLKLSLEGYQSRIISDLEVLPGRQTHLRLFFDPQPLLEEHVVVVGSSLTETRNTPTGTTSLSAREIQRQPGSEGDISRFLFSLPSVAKVSDNNNALVVRGGSPHENGFYIDNIEVPNINHFAIQGGGGGAIGLINVDFIEGVDFFAGAFGAAWSQRLSSITQMTWREGNPESTDWKVDLNLAGFGLQGEGPLGPRATWLFSARKSYLDLLAKGLGMEDAVPRYGDLQGKWVWKMSDRHHLSFIFLGGEDRLRMEEDWARNEGMDAAGSYYSRQWTAGLNWFALFSDHHHAQTSLSRSSQTFDNQFVSVITGKDAFFNQSEEGQWALRSVHHFNPEGDRISFDAGLELKRGNNQVSYHYEGGVDQQGNPFPDGQVAFTSHDLSSSAFAEAHWTFQQDFTLNAGISTQHHSVTRHIHPDPRISLQWRPWKRWAFSVGLGQYHQTLPTLVLHQNPEYTRLQDPQARHFNLRGEVTLGEGIQLSLEAFVKHYAHLPRNPTKADECLFDTLGMGQAFLVQEALTNDQEARSWGLELVLQKKLKDKLYGMFNASWGRSEYRNPGGLWTPRKSDNRFTMAIQGGYCPSRKQEWTFRWIYAGGCPYTPFDLERSTAANQGIFQDGRPNGVRRAPYNALNLRYERRFYMKKTSLNTYLSLWNVFNRKNPGDPYWNRVENAPAVEEQWGFMPVLGIEFVF